MNRRGIMALEERNEEAVVAEATPEVDLSFVDAPEADMAEAGEADAATEEVVDAVEEAGETAETLEGVADSMEATLPEGGMGEAEAKAVEIAVEHLCSRMGFKKRTFPAMEGFSKPENRVQATKIALESIKEKAAKIWETIVAAVKKAVEYVKTFFQHLMNAALKYSARAEAIAKKAASMKGKQHDASTKVKQGGELTHGGQHLAGSSFVSAVKKHVGQEVLNEDRVAKLAAAAGELGKIAEGDANAAAAAIKGFVSGFKSGDVQLVFGNATVETAVNESSAKVSIGSTGAASEGSAEVAPLSPEEVEEVAGTLAAHLKTVAERSGKAVKEAEAAANAVIGKVKQAAGKEGGDAAAASKLMSIAIALTTTAAKTIASYDVKVSAAALNYCGASLGAAKADVVSDKALAAPAAEPAAA